MFALNVVLITDDELWALRYPDVHELYVLERAAGGPTGPATSSTPARAARCACAPAIWPAAPAVVVASEPMDEDPGWRALRLRRARCTWIPT